MAKAFSKTTELDPKTVMIVDSLNLGFRWKHAGQFDFLEDYVRTVESLRKSYKAGKVVIASDWGSSSYRKAIYPLYKQNRKDKAEASTPEEQKEFELFFEEYMRVIDSFRESTHYPVFRFEKVEADDIAAYIVKNRQKLGIDKVVLISSDKDWDLLVSDQVMRFSYVTRKETTVDNWNDHYDYSPEDHISIKCLTGDSGDNIPGVPGVGPKRAVSLVQEWGSCYDIIANMPLAGKYKYIQNLNEFGPDALMTNYKLMDLLEFCDEALGAENCEAINNIMGEYLGQE